MQYIPKVQDTISLKLHRVIKFLMQFCTMKRKTRIISQMGLPWVKMILHMHVAVVVFFVNNCNVQIKATSFLWVFLLTVTMYKATSFSCFFVNNCNVQLRQLHSFKCCGRLLVYIFL